MKIQEYQAKQIFEEYQIPLPPAELATNPGQAEEAGRSLGFPVMIKVQILAGARAKGGGIREAKNPEELREIAFQLLGKQLITPQTPSSGLLVEKILVQKKIDIKRELYLGITVDRQKSCPVIIASKTGGTAIEEIVKKYPGEIVREYINPAFGLPEIQIKKLAFGLRPGAFLYPDLRDIILNLYRVFKERECSLVEINPLVISNDSQFYALDAKVVFDDNALFRHPENKALQDILTEDPLELEAQRIGINYVKLGGNIGCLVNGAGLAMATMDAIKFYGGEPANFLDVGGGATPEKIKKTMTILLSDPSLKAIFINIFGGILRCDILAQGLLMAFREKKFDLPLVLRLDGTNAFQAIKMLNEAKINFFKVSSLSQGAKKAVKLAKEGRTNEHFS